jgi:hypothetical protein
MCDDAFLQSVEKSLLEREMQRSENELASAALFNGISGGELDDLNAIDSETK